MALKLRALKEAQWKLSLLMTYSSLTDEAFFLLTCFSLTENRGRRAPAHFWGSNPLMKTIPFFNIRLGGMSVNEHHYFL